VFVLNKKTSMQTSLYASLLIGLALAAIGAGQIPLAAAQSNTPTYVLGVSSPLDPLVVDLQSQTSSVTILSGVSGLSLLGPGSILFIDGAWLQSVSSLDPTILPLLDSTLLNGVPSVVVRGTPTILQNSVSGLIKGQVPNLPLIAEGLKIFNTLPDGTRQGAALQVITGFDYAVSAEFTWAQQHLTNAIPLTFSPLLTSATTKTSTTGVLPAATSSPSGSWAQVLQLKVDTSSQFAAAEVISTFTIFKLQNGGGGGNKWYNFFANTTLIPGSAVSNSQWRNFSENDTINVNPSTNTIISHGPPSQITSGPTTVTYTIGVTASPLTGSVTANQTQTYMLKNTNVTDTSLPNQTSEVGWLHNIDPRSSSGKLQFSVIPGWTDQIPTSSGIDLHATFASTFVTLSGGQITATASTGVGLTVSGG
jgi:hypothetical protein